MGGDNREFIRKAREELENIIGKYDLTLDNKISDYINYLYVVSSPRTCRPSSLRFPWLTAA